jgi:hypothetical protein
VGSTKHLGEIALTHIDTQIRSDWCVCPWMAILGERCSQIRAKDESTDLLSCWLANS